MMNHAVTKTVKNFIVIMMIVIDGWGSRGCEQGKVWIQAPESRATATLVRLPSWSYLRHPHIYLRICSLCFYIHRLLPSTLIENHIFHGHTWTGRQGRRWRQHLRCRIHISFESRLKNKITCCTQGNWRRCKWHRNTIMVHLRLALACKGGGGGANGVEGHRSYEQLRM